jgi:hypothetical protein
MRGRRSVAECWRDASRSERPEATGGEQGMSGIAGRDGPGLDPQAMLRAVPRTAKLEFGGWYVWGGSMVRTGDGTCHLLFSRWPRRLGHRAWVTHSEVAHATADSPLGPYAFQGTALKGSGGEGWDAHMIHNPTVLQVGHRFYLYYTGNHGNGEYWNHRNNQRIGAAIADDPAGPWERFDRPLLEVVPGSWDHLITTNPSVTRSPDGRFFLMYKTVGEGDLPFGGKVVHGMAIAEHPLGPFHRHPEPVLSHPTEQFPLEDPFIWHGGDRFYAVLKDFRGLFTHAGPSLALFESADGIGWLPASRPLVSKLQIEWEDGEVQPVKHLERPQLYLEHGRPSVLFCACDVDDDRTSAFNVHIPLAQTGAGR